MNKKIDARIILGNILLVLGFLINIYFTFNFIMGSICFSNNKVLTLIFESFGMLSILLMFFILGLLPYSLGIMLLWFNENKTFKLNVIVLVVVHLIICLAYKYYIFY